MSTETKAGGRVRQILWILAGAVVITILVTAGSWLFSPSNKDNAKEKHKAEISEGTVENRSFQPEAVPEAKVQPDAKTEQATPSNVTKAPEEKAVVKQVAEPVKTASHKESVSSEASPSPESPKTTELSRISSNSKYGVQLGAFASKDNAEKLRKKLAAQKFNAVILQQENRFKVVIPGYKTRNEAEAARTKLKKLGFGGAFVVSLE